MHIVIIEKDWQDVRFLSEALNKAFPKYRLMVFKNVGEALISGITLNHASLIIMEEYLPLMPIMGDETARQYRNDLAALFPSVAPGTGWDHQLAGFLMVRYLRTHYSHVPIIIHSNSDACHCKSVQAFNVPYCIKQTDYEELFQRMRELLPMST